MHLKTLPNLPEAETDRRLREVCEDFDAKVYAKVRVADVLPIEGSGIDDRHYRYALQAHFDFVVADETDTPLFVVEFDGRNHTAPKAQSRDRMKNALCERFELPILRANRRYLTERFSNWDLIRWFCTVYFISGAWEQDVEAGRIPPEDSVFDPMFVSVRTKSGMRSLELEGQARAELGRLFRSGDLPFHVPNFSLATGSDHTLRALAWIMTSESGGVFVETAMQNHHFGIRVHFAVRGIALSMLLERVKETLNGSIPEVSVEELKSRVQVFDSRFTTIMALRGDRFV